MKEGQVFRIASISKQFTAAAILRLATEGKLNLKDDIRKYINGFLSNDSTVVTIANLLSHTSGIDDYNRTKDWEKTALKTDLSTKALVDIFKTKPLAFSPGEKFQYSNLGYVALGHIVEIVAGVSYAEYLHQTFFEPMGMTQTNYDQQSDIVPKRIPGYTQSNGTYLNADYLDMRIPKAAGGIRSNLTDLLIWYRGLFDDQVLNKAYLDLAHTPFQLNDGNLAPYGFGWRIGNINGVSSIKHDGIINGFTSVVIYLPEQEIFVGMFSNCDCARDIEIPASKMAAVVLGLPYDDAQVKESKDNLITYQGSYQSNDGGKKLITYQDGSLVYHDKGGGKVSLIPLGKNQFKLKEELVYLEFSEDKKSYLLKTTGLPNLWKRSSDEHMAFQSVEITPNTLEKYLGKYKFPDAFTFEVVKEGNKVYGQVGNDRHEIQAYDQNKFYAVTIDARLIFDLESSGEVTGLTLIQNQEMKAKKLASPK